MQKITITNISNICVNLSSMGFPRIQLSHNESHVFGSAQEYAPYANSAKLLLESKILHMHIGDSKNPSIKEAAKEELAKVELAKEVHIEQPKVEVKKPGPKAKAVVKDPQ